MSSNGDPLEHQANAWGGIDPAFDVEAMRREWERQ